MYPPRQIRQKKVARDRNPAQIRKKERELRGTIKQAVVFKKSFLVITCIGLTDTRYDDVETSQFNLNLLVALDALLATLGRLAGARSEAYPAPDALAHGADLLRIEQERFFGRVRACGRDSRNGARSMISTSLDWLQELGLEIGDELAPVILKVGRPRLQCALGVREIGNVRIVARKD